MMALDFEALGMKTPAQNRKKRKINVTASQDFLNR
jgi:hypothetical protein